MKKLKKMPPRLTFLERLLLLIVLSITIGVAAMEVSALAGLSPVKSMELGALVAWNVFACESLRRVYSAFSRQINRLSLLIGRSLLKSWRAAVLFALILVQLWVVGIKIQFGTPLAWALFLSLTWAMLYETLPKKFCQLSAIDILMITLAIFYGTTITGLFIQGYSSGLWILGPLMPLILLSRIMLEQTD